MLFGKNLLKYYKKYWYLYLFGLIALFCVDYFGSVIPPKIIGSIIDSLDGNHDFLGSFGDAFKRLGSIFIDVIKGNELTGKYYLSDLILLYFIIAVVNFACRFLWRVCFFTIGNEASRDLRHRMFKNSLTLSEAFYKDNKVGGLMSYYINDIGSIRETINWGTLMFFDTLFLVPMVFIQMLEINVVVSLLTLIPLAFILISSIVVGKSLEKRYKLRQDKFEELSDFTQESISGIRVIKAFVQEIREYKDFRKKNKENEEVNMAYLKLNIFFNEALDLFIWLIYFAILLGGAYFVTVKPEITVGELTELVAYFDSLLWPMFAIGDLMNIRSRGKASLERVDVLLDTKTDLVDAKEELDLTNFKGSIEFNHLTFEFPDHKKHSKAINDITFKINAGEFVGIIGKTGSSKSTLVNLLLRRYNINKNMILIDDKDIMEYPVKQLRGKIGYVPQDNFLYSTTVEENIAFSSRTIDKEKVIKCAKIAGVHDDIMGFEQGYQTKLGERGVSVSGGQKQRISIARALYMNPDILILDDALSAVDTKTEAEILKFLKEERKGKTTLLIAHRISSIKDADKILVLEFGGRVSGYDTHEHLLENNIGYKETYNLQQLEREGGISHV